MGIANNGETYTTHGVGIQLDSNLLQAAQVFQCYQHENSAGASAITTRETNVIVTLYAN